MFLGYKNRSKNILNEGLGLNKDLDKFYENNGKLSAFKKNFVQGKEMILNDNEFYNLINFILYPMPFCKPTKQNFQQIISICKIKKIVDANNVALLENFADYINVLESKKHYLKQLKIKFLIFLVVVDVLIMFVIVKRHNYKIEDNKHSIRKLIKKEQKLNGL